ncbi:MAG: hypothetical protein J6V29_06020 [Bacteroidales bacterium]|nr:hypothetical protein [Bacteroidales bacterium]
MNLRKLFLSATVAVMAIFAASCNKNEEVIIPVDITISEEAIAIDSTGGTATLVLKSNRPWSVEKIVDNPWGNENADWLTVEPMSGDANVDGINITVSAGVNATDSVNYERSVIVYFRSDKEIFASTIVTQDGVMKPNAWSYVSISELRELAPESNTSEDRVAINEPWMLRGVVVSANDPQTVSNKNLFIQDGTEPGSGLLIYSDAFASCNFGDVVEVKLKGGQMYYYYKMLQFVPENTSMVVNTGEKEEPEAAFIENGEDFVNGLYEGQYVKMFAQVTTESLGLTMGESPKVETEDGSSFLMYSRSNVPWAGAQVPQGAGEMYGLCSSYSGVYQIVPQRESDFEGMTGARFKGRPTVVTNDAVVSEDMTSATLSGSYTYDGEDADITEVGFAVMTSAEEEFTYTSVEKAAEFEYVLEDLQAATTYKYKAYIKIGERVYEGAEKSFATSSSEYTPIAQVEDGGTYTMNGVVTARSARGFILTDNTGSIFYYNSAYTDEYAIGQELTVTGTIGNYNRGLQITAEGAMIEAGEVSEYNYPAPEEATAAVIDAYIADEELRLAEYVVLKGVLSVSGNYFNVVVEGTENQGSVYYPAEDIKAELAACNGSEVTLYGYSTSVSSGKYFNMIVTSFEGDQNQSETAKIGELAEGDYATVSGTVTAIGARGFILTDETGSIMYYDPSYSADYVIGQQLTITTNVGSYNKGLQLSSTTDIEVNSVIDYNYPQAQVITSAELDSYIADTELRFAEYVSLECTLSVSGTYYNLTVEGTENQGSIYYPNAALKEVIEANNGAKMTVYGYSISVSGGKYMNILPTDIVVGEPGENPDPEQPGDITNIADVELDGTYTLNGIVSAINVRGFIFSDETGSILYYNPDYSAGYQIGQELTITGKVSAYNTGFQLDASAEIVEGANVGMTYPEAIVADATFIDSFVAETANRLAVYVEVTAQLSISGNYYNLVVDGTSNQGSFYFLTSDIKSQISEANGAQVKVLGYASSVSSGKYMNIVATSVEILEMPEPEEPENPSDFLYSWELESGDVKEEAFTAGTPALTWTPTYTWGGTPYFGWDSNNVKGVQIGSGNNPAKAFSLETTVPAEMKISDILINTSGASSIAGTLNVFVNDVQVGQTITLTKTATDYTLTLDTPVAGADIRFEYAQTSSKAIYIKYIKFDGEIVENGGEDEGFVEDPKYADFTVAQFGSFSAYSDIYKSYVFNVNGNNHLVELGCPATEGPAPAGDYTYGGGSYSIQSDSGMYQGWSIINYKSGTIHIEEAGDGNWFIAVDVVDYNGNVHQYKYLGSLSNY